MGRKVNKKAGLKGTPAVEESAVAKVLEDAQNTDFRDPTDCQRFQDTHRSRLTKDPSTHYLKDEVLNELARNKNLGVFTGFAKWAVQNHKSLLQCKTDGGFTPLHLAIRAKNHEFVGLVFRYAEDVSALLSEMSDLDMTCLHLAIDYASPFTEEMIARCLDKPGSTAGYAAAQTAALAAAGTAASTPGYPANGFGKSFSGPSGPVDVFTVKSKETEYKGMTPLHMAVVSDRDAVDAQTLFQSSTTHSTTKATRGRSKAKQPSQEQDAPSVDSGPDRLTANKGLRRATTLEMGKTNLSSRGPETPITKSTETPVEDFDLLRDARAFELLNIVKKLVEARPEVLVGIKDAAGNTPFQAALEELQQQLKPFEPLRTDAERENWRHKLVENDTILSYLRTYIIDKFERRDAMRALYKIGDERVLEFDLSGLPKSSINSEFLHGLGKVLRFEGLLKYVALPRLAIEDEDAMDGTMVQQQGQGAKSTSGTGLQHICTVFRWLKKHHVKSVLKVTVVDDVEPSHSDEAIEMCLADLDVRIWNWYKVDLCANVIVESAINSREVTLYSSGNNAILTGWSSTAGLSRLEKLEKVRVFVQEGLETPKRLTRYINEFEKELKKNIEGVQVECTLHKPNSDYNNVFIEQGEGKATESKWMKTMGEFAEFLKSVKPEPRVQPIKIAVIDDGIDTSLEDFTDKIQVGESFYQLSELFGRRNSYYVPTGKHGTLMAQSICKVCPPVKLFIAQLEVLPGQNGQRSFTAESATEAIEWAVDQGVDIISMSWSISSRSVLGKFEDAIQRADKNHIIMFCASIDEGPTTVDNTYPGRIGGCIKIGASTGVGNKLSWVSGSSSDFLLPGEVPQPVAAFSGLRTQGQPHPYMDMFGSSVSTALAAGLAGVLLYCDRLLKSEHSHLQAADTTKALGTPIASDVMAGGGLGGGGDQIVLDELRAKSKMAEAFRTLSKGSEINKFPQVWEHLPQNRKLVWNKKADPDGTQRTINELEAFMELVKR